MCWVVFQLEFYSDLVYDRILGFGIGFGRIQWFRWRFGFGRIHDFCHRIRAESKTSTIYRCLLLLWMLRDFLVVGDRNSSFGFGSAETLGFGFGFGFFGFGFGFGFGQWNQTETQPKLFSTAGDVLTNERNRLKPENASKILFLKENLPIVNFQY